MKQLVALLIAGLFGTLCRYGITQIPWPKGFAYGTLAVNLLGAFLAGFCYIWLNAKLPQYAAWFPVVFIGFFGAFTTFSTFMLDSAKYLTAGNYGLFAANIVLQNVLGIGCVLGGIAMAKTMVN